MKKIIWLGCIAFFCLNCQGQVQEQAQLSWAEKDSLVQVYQQRVKNYLRKTGDIDNHLAISPEGIRISYFEGEAEEDDNPSEPKNRKKIEELSLDWEQCLKLKAYFNHSPQNVYAAYIDGSLPELLASPAAAPQSIPKARPGDLSGFRIALDPGHMAGSLQEAIQEGKYITLSHPTGKKIRFFESKIAWYTSRILADTLERLGAEVILTRDAYPLTALDTTYDAWWTNYKQQNPTEPLSKWKFFFKTFKKIEFKKRIDKINQFRPHLTLIMHYNVDANNTGWKKTTPLNNSMAFVGGSFMDGELLSPEKRFHMLRQLLGKGTPESIAFSKSILEALDTHIGVKTIPRKNKQFFLDDYCLYGGEPGIYHRNLTLAREVYGVLCYAEPLYQDNVQESLRFGENTLMYEGEAISPRIQEVAYAYLAGIVAYLQRKK